MFVFIPVKSFSKNFTKKCKAEAPPMDLTPLGIQVFFKENVRPRPPQWI
jgi:hypothetical protein